MTDDLSTDFRSGPSHPSSMGHIRDEEFHDEDDNHSYIFEDSDDEDDNDSDLAHEMELRLPQYLKQPQDDSDAGEDSKRLSWTSVAEGDNATSNSLSDPDDEQGRNVKQKTSHPSSPRGPLPDLALAPGESSVPVKAMIAKEPVLGPAKLRVVVKDAAYVTYRAVLFYVSVAVRILCRIHLFII